MLVRLNRYIITDSEIKPVCQCEHRKNSVLTGNFSQSLVAMSTFTNF